MQMDKASDSRCRGCVSSHGTVATATEQLRFDSKEPLCASSRMHSGAPCKISMEIDRRGQCKWIRHLIHGAEDVFQAMERLRRLPNSYGSTRKNRSAPRHECTPARLARYQWK